MDPKSKQSPELWRWIGSAVCPAWRGGERQIGPRRGQVAFRQTDHVIEGSDGQSLTFKCSSFHACRTQAGKALAAEGEGSSSLGCQVRQWQIQYKCYTARASYQTFPSSGHREANSFLFWDHQITPTSLIFICHDTWAQQPNAWLGVPIERGHVFQQARN